MDRHDGQADHDKMDKPGRLTDRWMDKQTDRQAGKQTDTLVNTT